jgi:predicted ribosome quality control (RQC) complex YloA/Tae2 family protein
MVKCYYYIPNDNKLIQYYNNNELPIDSSYLIIKMGQSDLENTKLVKDASEVDWWFHLADYPSAHALTYFQLSNDVDDYDFLKDPFLKNLMATVVKDHSKQKYLNKVKVHYCLQKNLKLGDKAGLIILKKVPNTITI